MFFFQNLFLADNARNLFFDQIFLSLDFFQIFADAGGIFLQIRHGFAQKHGAADYFHRRQRLHKQCLGRFQRQILQRGERFNQVVVFNNKVFFGFFEVGTQSFQLAFHSGDFFFAVLYLFGGSYHVFADTGQFQAYLRRLRLQLFMFKVLRLNFPFHFGQIGLGHIGRHNRPKHESQNPHAQDQRYVLRPTFHAI